jgi:hypothetical protein
LGFAPRKDFTSEKLRASVRVAFKPSTTKACRKFSLLRRCAYRGEFAILKTLLDNAESMLNALATLPISIPGSCANSMICAATPGGDGKFTDRRRWASSSEFKTRLQTQKRIGIRLCRVNVHAAKNLNA